MQGSAPHKWVGLFSSLMSKRGKVLPAEASSPVQPGTARLCAKACACRSCHELPLRELPSWNHSWVKSPRWPFLPMPPGVALRGLGHPQTPAPRGAEATRGWWAAPTSMSPPRVSSLGPRVTCSHGPWDPGSVGQFWLIPLWGVFPRSRWSDYTLSSLVMCMIRAMGVRGGLSFSGTLGSGA